MFDRGESDLAQEDGEHHLDGDIDGQVSVRGVRVPSAHHSKRREGSSSEMDVRVELDFNAHQIEGGKQPDDGKDCPKKECETFPMKTHNSRRRGRRALT